MNLTLKIILGLTALAAVLGVIFYIWMVIAYTPPKASGPMPEEGIVKQGLTNGDHPGYFGIGWRDDGEGRVYTVAIGPPTDDMGGENIMIVRGAPTPIDIIAPSPGKIAVVFDGKLANGADRVEITVDSNFRVPAIIEIENGAVIGQSR